MTNLGTPISASRTSPSSAGDTLNWRAQVADMISVACRHEFSNFPDLRRWEMTGDVAQQTALSLLDTIDSNKVRPTSQDHLRRIVRLHVKWAFLTLARRHHRSVWSTHATPLGRMDAPRAEEAHVSEMTPLQQKVDWLQFHCDVDALPEIQREVFRRVWYHEAKKSEIAKDLGISIRTVQRHYRLACEELMKTIGIFN